MRPGCVMGREREVWPEERRHELCPKTGTVTKQRKCVSDCVGQRAGVSSPRRSLARVLAACSLPVPLRSGGLRRPGDRRGFERQPFSLSRHGNDRHQLHGVQRHRCIGRGGGAAFGHARRQNGRREMVGLGRRPKLGRGHDRCKRSIHAAELSDGRQCAGDVDRLPGGQPVNSSQHKADHPARLPATADSGKRGAGSGRNRDYHGLYCRSWRVNGCELCPFRHSHRIGRRVGVIGQDKLHAEQQRIHVLRGAVYGAGFRSSGGNHLCCCNRRSIGRERSDRSAVEHSGDFE